MPQTIHPLTLAAIALLEAEESGDHRAVDSALAGLSRDEVWALSERLERAMSTCKYHVEVCDG